MLRAFPRETSKIALSTCSPSPVLHLTVHDSFSFTLCTTRLRVGLYSHLRSGTATRALAKGPPCTNEPITQGLLEAATPCAAHNVSASSGRLSRPTLGYTCGQQSQQNRDADSVRFPRQGPLRLLRALVLPTHAKLRQLRWVSTPNHRNAEARTDDCQVTHSRQATVTGKTRELHNVQ